jgi:hypothetical protein
MQARLPIKTLSRLSRQINQTDLEYTTLLPSNLIYRSAENRDVVES